MMPGELSLIQGAPEMLVWRPHYGWRKANLERERVPLQGLLGRARLKRWLDARVPKAFPLPFEPLVLLMVRDVEDDWVSFGVVLMRPRGLASISWDLAKHLV